MCKPFQSTAYRDSLVMQRIIGNAEEMFCEYKVCRRGNSVDAKFTSEMRGLKLIVDREAPLYKASECLLKKYIEEKVVFKRV